MANTESSGSDGALRVHLFGGFHASVDGCHVPESAWRLSKARSLVKLLCLSPGHRLHREQVIDLLFREIDPGAAVNNLHQTIYAARRALATVLSDEPAIRLSRQDQSVALEPSGGLTVDTDRFQDRARRAQASRNLEDYYAAVELYTGDLLPDDVYEEWLAVHRDTFRNTVLNLLVELSQIHQARDEILPAIDALRRAVEIEPVVETNHADLMRLYAESGMPRLAMRQYAVLAEVLAREMDVGPSPGTEELYESIQRGDLGSSDDYHLAGPLLDTVTLPRSLTSFIGRSHEIDSLTTLLTGPGAYARLLTLVGPGGTGKTRLAVEVGGRVVEYFPAGVHFVDLSALRDPGLVVTSVANALHIPEIPGRTYLSSLILSIADRRMLLILDNLEQVLDAATDLVHLVAACPRLVVLVTSREILNVQGEYVYQLEPLSRHDAYDINPTDAAGFEAVQLFIDRSRLALGAFELVDENVASVLSICNRLDGLPLAIELAAARTRTLPVPALAHHITRALDVLDDGPRDLPARQRTLRDTIAWSFDLLEPNEQVLLRRLAVFNGGWSTEAAEQVCDFHHQTTDNTVSAINFELLSLLDKSLIRRVATSGVEPRFDMLLTIRDFAGEQLDMAGESAEIRCRHAIYYRDLAWEAEPNLTGAGRAPWIERLNREIGNIRDALAWSVETRQPAIGLDLIGSLSIWSYREHPSDSFHWATTLLGMPEASERTLGRSLAALTAGASAIAIGDMASAHAYLAESDAIAREVGARNFPELKRYLFQSLIWQLLLATDDFEHGRAIHREAERLSHEMEHGWALAWTQTFGGQMYGLFGHGEHAFHLLSEGSRIAEELGDPWIIGVATEFQGILLLVSGEMEAAEAYFSRCLELYEADGSQQSLAHIHILLAGIAQMAGDLESAERHLEEALRGSYTYGDLGTAILALEAIGGVAGSMGSFERSTQLLAAAHGLRERTGAIPALGPQFVELLSQLQTDVRSELQQALGDQPFEAIWGEGARMNETEAYQYALGGLS